MRTSTVQVTHSYIQILTPYPLSRGEKRGIMIIIKMPEKEQI